MTFPTSDQRRKQADLFIFKAIEYALNHALPVDTILIAGKGHENYQIIAGETRTFSDVACVEQLLKKG